MMLKPLCVLLLAVGCSHAAVTKDANPVASSEAPLSFTARVSGNGQPAIFIPDVGAPAEVWDTTVEHLGGRVEAHVLEVAGFSGNPATTSPLLPRLKSELAAYIRGYNLRKPVIVGHMLGASVAYWLAMTDPQLVGGLVAVDAPPSRSEGSADDAAEAESMKRAMETATPEQFSSMQTRRLASMMKDQERAARLASRIAQSSQPVLAEVTFDILTRDLRSSIPNIKAPVLVIMTTENFPKAAFPEVQAAFEQELAPISQHTLFVVEGSGHYVMFDAQDVFFGKLDAFLQSVASAP